MPDNNDAAQLEKMRKAAAAFLDALGPEQAQPPEEPAAAKVEEKPAAANGAHRHNLQYTDTGAFCVDCDERLVKAPKDPMDLIDQLNTDFHKKHDFLACPECKGAFGKKVESMAEGKYKFSDDGKVIKITRQK